MRTILSLMAVAGIAAAGGSAAGAPSGRVVFSSGSGAGGKDQVWVMNANGTGRHAVTPATFDARAPAASADGRQVAYVRLGEVYAMRSNGTHVRRLTTSGATEGAPAWSPSGRWIAYSSYSSGRSSIWKMGSDGSGKTRLAVGSGLDVPAWSPNGGRIAYAAHYRIWVMNADGSGKHALTHGPNGGGVDWASSWSPDGRRVAYESNVGTGPRDLTNEIWVVNADGSHPVRLTHNALNDGHPVWSPDGSWLLFASERPHPGTTHLWLMHPNGKGLHRATSWAGEQFSPSWAR
jgi:TolB protein